MHTGTKEFTLIKSARIVLQAPNCRKSLSERTHNNRHLDFARLLVLSLSDGPGIIMFRGGNYPILRCKMNLLETALSRVPVDVLASSICVVYEKRLRVTRLPLEPKS